MDISVQDDIDNYYKLKSAYEDKLARQKKRIFKNETLSKKDKRLKLQQLKKQCINCKQNGGTLFNTDGEQLTAICGASEPCKLDIVIQRGKYENIRTRKNYLFHEIQNIHSDIILTKLDLLFNFIKEEEAVSSFHEYREDLDIISKNYTDESIKYLNITNSDTKKKELDEYKVTLFIEKEKLRALYKEYLNDPQKKYIIEMTEKYITIIRPLVTKIRETTYVLSSVEKDENSINKLIELPYTLEQLIQSESKQAIAKIIRYNK